MKTLFLNPNGSAAVTQLLRERIAAARPPFAWELRRVEEAPEVIASAEDNARAEAALAARLGALAASCDRLVLMSSLDTGHALAAAALPRLRVRGFTRGVLAAQRARGRRIQVLSFGAAMAPLYEPVFAAGGGAQVIAGRAVFEAAPAALLGPDAQALRDGLGRACDALHAEAGLPVFVVGALALSIADQLRAQGRPWLLDPVAELLDALASDASPPGGPPTQGDFS